VPIGVIALVVRASFVLVQLRWHPFDIAFDAADSATYRRLAASLRTGQYSLDEPTMVYPPGYPVFLAAVYTIGASALVIGLVQCILGALTVVLLASIADQAAGKRAAIATGLIAACYPGIVFWTGYVLTETLFCFLLVVAFWLTLRWFQRPEGWGTAAAVGLAFGAAALTRPIALPFALLLLGAAVGDRSTRRSAGVCLIALVVVLAPWTIRNEIVFNAPIFTSTDSSYVLWRGNHPGVTAGRGGYNNPADYVNLSFPEGTSEAEVASVHRDRALTWMASHPGRVLELVPGKLWNMLRPNHEGSSVANRALTTVSYLPLLLLGTIGLVIFLRGRYRMLIAGYLIYSLVFHGIVFAIIRYRLPLEMLLTVPAGVTVAWCSARFRSRRDEENPGDTVSLVR